MYARLERDFDRKLRIFEQCHGSNLERGYINCQQRTDERVSNVERRHAKVEDVVEKLRSYTEKVERKLKEVVEQNVSIKILVDSIKTRQAYHERQMSQMTGLITQ